MHPPTSLRGMQMHANAARVVLLLQHAHDRTVPATHMHAEADQRTLPASMVMQLGSAGQHQGQCWTASPLAMTTKVNAWPSIAPAAGAQLVPQSAHRTPTRAGAITRRQAARQRIIGTPKSQYHAAQRRERVCVCRAQVLCKPQPCVQPLARAVGARHNPTCWKNPGRSTPH